MRLRVRVLHSPFIPYREITELEPGDPGRTNVGDQSTNARWPILVARFSVLR